MLEKGNIYEAVWSGERPMFFLVLKVHKHHGGDETYTIVRSDGMIITHCHGAGAQRVF